MILELEGRVMLGSTRTGRGVAALLVVAVMVTGLVPAVHAGVELFPASLVPAAVVTEVDSVFTVEFRVGVGASQFNAYEITLSFDPAILEFQSVSEGTLMLSGCGNTFDFLTTTDSTLTYSHSLLCGGVALDGPGLLSTYTFLAVGDGISPLEITSSPDSSFFDNGMFVSPLHPTRPRQVTLTSTVVAVGMDPTGSPKSGSGSRSGLSVRPNPMRGAGEIRFELVRAGWAELEILDVRGRRVLARSWPSLGSGSHRLEWAARGEAGGPLPGGVYVIRVADEQGVRTSKVTLVR
ncbi:MAG: hypothetical protein DHS20C21_07490 [Gemmatimonadota bacterium]|nr:MAG: hypothetical protein DHS20C21_07490 [Gemmatimonadota bacterium]